MRSWLSRSWWILWPSYSGIVVWLAVATACTQPKEILPGLDASPVWGWLLALIYVCAHAWIVAAYVQTIEWTGSLVPGLARVRTACHGPFAQVVLMLGAFAVDHAPVTLWRMIGAGIFRCAVQ